MGIRDEYYIKEIDYNTAENVVVKCHYAHRTAPYTHAFGLFSKTLKQLVGVVIYGSPVSHSLCEGVCGFDERHNVYELTRLYVDDGLPKNLESFLVGNTIKLLDKEIIVSYSDTKYNHVGIIYQATNFYYTGLSAERSDPINVNGGHNRHVKQRICDGVEAVRRSPKHRYIYIYISMPIKSVKKSC